MLSGEIVLKNNHYYDPASLHGTDEICLPDKKTQLSNISDQPK